MSKVTLGSKIVITKKVALDLKNAYIIEPGEVFVVEALTETGAIRITKVFKSGVAKRAMVSKTNYRAL